MANQPTRISLIGLGAMGSALARTYISSPIPHKVTLYNRTASKADPFHSLDNVTIASSAAEAITGSPLIITCLLSNSVVSSLLMDLSPEQCKGRTLVNLTNGTPDQARELDIQTKNLGFQTYLHGGIMVPPNLVGTSDSVILCSSSQETFTEIGATLKIIGTPILMGTDPGCASLYDNALLSGMYGLLGGFLHSVALIDSHSKSGPGESMGVVPFTEKLLMPLLQGILGMLPKLAKQVQDKDFRSGEEGSPLGMQLVALENIFETSKGLGVRTALLEEMERLVRNRVAREGGGEQEFGSLIDGMFEDHMNLKLMI